MRTSCYGCPNYLYDIAFHSPGREGHCTIHGWVQFWFPQCIEAPPAETPPAEPQQKQISHAFYHERKDAIKAQIKALRLRYLPDYSKGDRSKWGYGGTKGMITFHREGDIITVTASSAELLHVLEV